MTMRKLLLAAMVVMSMNMYTQNVGINTTGATPNASAILDVDGAPTNDKGVLLPRVSLVASNNPLPIANPATSLVVYNTATAGSLPNNVVPGFYYWDGTKWQNIGSVGAYGMAYKISTYIIGTLNTWYPLTLDGGNTNLVNVAHSTSNNPERLTVSLAGTYEVSYGVTFLNFGNAMTPCARLNINGTTPVIGSGRCHAFIPNHNLSISNTTIVNLQANDYIQLEVRGDLTSGCQVCVIYNETSAQVTIKRIGP